MRKSNKTSLPSIRQLLGAQKFAESNVLYGKSLLNNKIGSIVSYEDQASFTDGLLVVNDEASVNGDGLQAIDKLTGLVVVSRASKKTPSSKVLTLLDLCKKSKVPLVVLKSEIAFGKALQALKNSFENYSDDSNSKANDVHSRVFNVVLEYGIDGLANYVREELRRPVCIETFDFKIVSSINMTGTPVRSRKKLVQECQNLVEGTSIDDTTGDVAFVRLGKRLVLPLIQGKNSIVGFLSVMMRSEDKEVDLLWLLKPASLASMVSLVQKKRGTKATSSAKKSLLCDLLEGRNLSSVELEKVEIHFGFDYFDGFYVLATNILSEKTGQKPVVTTWPDEIYVSVQVEDTRVFVIPFLSGAKLSYEGASKNLADSIKSRNKDVIVQIGTSRKVTSMLEFHDAYKQARQSLIIGSMMHSGIEYTIGYGDLGLMRLLYLIIDHPELEQFYKETLGPLEDYDKEWDTELTETLRVYVNHGANLNSAARALFIHRHTLRYRLEQIEDDILHIDVDSQEVLLNLQVAFLIKQLLDS